MKQEIKYEKFEKKVKILWKETKTKMYKYTLYNIAFKGNMF